MALRLGVTVPAGHWPALLSAATFPQMRAHASQLVQGPPGILIDDTGFFRSGTSGAGRGTGAGCGGGGITAAGQLS